MKILVVDDETVVVRSLSRAFGSCHHQVEVAYTGSEGLEKWLSFDPDVVLLDVVMPAMTGPQVIEAYKKERAHMRAQVLLMTAHSGISNLENAVKAGAHDFVAKPFDDIFTLVKKVEGMVGSKS